MALDRFQLLSLLGVDKDYFTQNPNLTPEQIDILYQTKGVNKDFLAQYPKLSEEQFMRFFNDKDVNKKYLAQNRNLTPEQIDLLYQTKGGFMGANIDNLARYPKLTDEQFQRIAVQTSAQRNFLAMNPSINPPANKPFVSGIFNWRW